MKGFDHAAMYMGWKNGSTGMNFWKEKMLKRF